MTTEPNSGETRNVSKSVPFVELHRSLASDVACISPIVDQLMRFIKLFMGKFGAGKNAEDDIEIAIHQALTNAVTHGNHEDPGKRVSVTCRCCLDGEVLITVRDEGLGFDFRVVPNPGESQRRLLPYGCGLLRMRTVMDEVSFEENGTVVRMRKRMKPQLDGCAESITRTAH
jgi:serine/threonine-protein kinase RsbW